MKDLRKTCDVLSFNLQEFLVIGGREKTTIGEEKRVAKRQGELKVTFYASRIA